MVGIFGGSISGAGAAVRFAWLRVEWHCLWRLHCPLRVKVGGKVRHYCFDCGDVVGYTSSLTSPPK